ncbi:MAG: 30S ribosomal protein S4 [Oscillospiraceae bacterium]|nr:30S ribosomal protein S4 [Oscillospiraceae bacterium]
MAVQKEPIMKKCRTLGISPAVMGVSKKESNRFKNVTNRKKVSEYGTQLKEKQKLKFIYGMLEKQFHHYFEIATKMEGKTGDNLITVLESRLDNVVFRLGLALTRREARQLVAHAHFTVNGQKVNIPSYRVKVGDVIALREKDRTSEKFKATVEATADRVVPLWLTAKKEDFSATVVRMPSADDIEYEAQTHLIVELYSK